MGDSVRDILELALSRMALIADYGVAMQSGLFIAAVVFFLVSLAFCIRALKSSGEARRAKNDAARYVLTAKDLLAEMRQLTAQMERTRSLHLAEMRRAGGADDTLDDEESALKAAKSAATVPASLLAGDDAPSETREDAAEDPNAPDQTTPVDKQS